MKRTLRMRMMMAQRIQAAWRTVRGKLPPMSGAMRTYLLYCVVLYGLATVALLAPRHGLRVPHTGLVWVDATIPHAIWGLTALLVCLSQFAALLSPRWVVWQVCAVMTAMWASGWAVVILALSARSGNYSGTLVWLFVVGIHFLVIGNDISPHDGSNGHSEHPPGTGAVPDEQALVDSMERVIRETPTDDTHPLHPYLLAPVF